jgi:hypothetical protein
MWSRVFCRSAEPIAAAALLQRLRDLGLEPLADFRGDDLGWTSGEIRVGVGAPVYLERYLADMDDLRDDLNSWAAFLETCDYSPNATMLMERVIQTQQLVTIRKPIDHADEVLLEKVCAALCQYLAEEADGVCQADGDGWRAADGQLLLKEY